MDERQAEIDQILSRTSSGDHEPAAQLLEAAYAELRAIAGSYFRGQAAAQTLQPTALVHEAFVNLAARETLEIQDRNHFLALCALAMRSILVDHARRRASSKRGGDWNRLTLSEAASSSELDAIDVLALDEALVKLNALSPRQALVIEYRFFAGLDVAEIATVVDRPVRTVQSDLRMARAWLKVELEKGAA